MSILLFFCVYLVLFGAIMLFNSIAALLEPRSESIEAGIEPEETHHRMAA